jgi:chromosome segregation ATPase
MSERNRDLETTLSKLRNDLNEKDKLIENMKLTNSQTTQNNNNETIVKIITERNTELEKSVSHMRKLLDDKNKEIDELNVKIVNLKIDKMDTDKNEPSQSSYTRIPIEVVDSAQITPLEKTKTKPKTKSEPEFIIDISM